MRLHTNFLCLLCYFSTDDIIYDDKDKYVIADNFSFIHHHMYVKQADRKEAKLKGTLPPLSLMKKKYKIPEFIKNIPNWHLSVNNFNFQVNGKKYNFDDVYDKEKILKLAKKMSKDIAKRYTSDSTYRKYVDDRFNQLEKYDRGRKKLDVTDINGWKIVKFLSSGMYGATYIVSKGGKEYVMKTFHTKKRSPKAVEKECNITKLAGELGVGPKVIECSSNVPQYIVMKKLDGPSVQVKNGSLSKVLMPPSDLRKLEEKMKILDAHHIKHNDLHLGNVLYHKGELYVIDYGMSNIVKAKVMNQIKKG